MIHSTDVLRHYLGLVQGTVIVEGSWVVYALYLFIVRVSIGE